MPQIVAQKYSLVNVEPSTLVMTQIDEMFRDLFTGLRNSAVGSANSQELALDASSFTQGDLLYIVHTVGTVEGLTVGATAGRLIRSTGTLPAWSTLILPNSAASGDLVYASATNTWGGLTVAAAGKVIRSTGSIPAYSTFTIPDTFTQGAIPYASSANVLVGLTKDASATRYLSNTGASNNPAWAQVNVANGVTGDLPFANLTQIAGLSVLGVTGASTADVAAMTAASDFQVLRRSGSAVAFGAIELAQSAAVTGILPIGNGGTGITIATDIRKTADETITDTTLQDDDHLTISLAATSAHPFRYFLFLTNGGAAEGFPADLSGTVGVSSLKAQVQIWDDTLNTLVACARVTALSASVGAGLSSGSNFAIIDGTIETTTGGTFLIRWAQNATGASAGVTVEEQSSLIVRKLNA